MKTREKEQEIEGVGKGCYKHELMNKFQKWEVPNPQVGNIL